MLFPLRYSGVTKLMVFFNCCTTSRKTSLPQIWFWLRYKHYGGKRTETSANNKYSNNTTYQNRWADIFHHDYIQLIYLRENGFDFKKYQQSKTTYTSKHKIGLCECSLPLIELHCEVCDSD